MNPARFNKRISIQSFIEVENGMGDVVKDWVEFKRPWAMIKTTQGREVIQAAGIQGEITTRFVIRYTAGITNDMRILYQERIFNIIAPPINDDEANKTLTIIGKEVL